nr:hypothetical protein [Tanacetum cinerariifolium]
RAEGIYPGTLPLDRVEVLDSSSSLSILLPWISHDLYVMEMIRQYSRRDRIPQSSALPTAADEPVSPLGDDSQGEACPTVSGLKAKHDRANIIKTSTLPHDSTPRVSFLADDEGSMQQQLNELTNLCTRLQRQQTKMASKITAQDLEVASLKARIKMLEDKDGGVAEPSGEDATIKGRSLETGEEAGVDKSTERGSNDTEELVNVLTSLDATSILTSGVQVVSVPPAAEVATVSVPTGSDEFPLPEDFPTAIEERFPLLSRFYSSELASSLAEGTGEVGSMERECKLYDAFDKFTHIKGESLHTYYLRFTQLINDMNIYKMNMEQFQVNTKFLNSLPPEWSKFVTDVKLVKDLHTSNYDQLHVYLEQHELHVNEVRLMHDPIACLNKEIAFLTAVASLRFSTTNNQLRTSSNTRNQATIQDGRVTVQQVQGRQGKNYSGTTYKGNATSSRGNTTSGQARVVKCYNCQDLGIPVGQAQTIIPHNAAFQTEDLDTYDSDCDDLSNAQAVLMSNISNYGSDVLSEVPNFDNYLNDMDNQSYQNPSYLKKDQQMKPTLYDGIVTFEKRVAMHVIDNDETLLLQEESRSKMFEKAKDPKTVKQNISHKPIDYEKLNRLTKDFEKRFTLQQELSAEQAFWLSISNPTIESSLPHVRVEVPIELPKVPLTYVIFELSLRSSSIVHLLIILAVEYCHLGFAAVLAVLKPERLKADRARNE